MGVLQTIGRFAGSRDGLVLEMRPVSAEVSIRPRPLCDAGGVGDASGLRSGQAP
ncbi:hypothetical protein ABZW96_29695 [Nocardia sp. NPDC004168]|uniref:hypothetical protein n=1 Tax=Nocardia sp. NPDC004168 TaxID=3154452 RepID=UPI0033B6B999